MIKNKIYAFAPGRVNLIGEHLDYNGGKVLPIAIQKGIRLRLELNDSGCFHFQSSESHSSPSVNIDKMPESRISVLDWANYPVGVLRSLMNKGLPLKGGSFSYQSDLPEGSGLSSSAALEAVTAFALLTAFEKTVDRINLASVCREVENEFIGLPCGIMDQLSVCAAKKEHALLIDCSRTSIQHIPFQTGRFAIVVMNTRKPRSLIQSKYSERLNECREALGIIQKSFPEIEHLSLAEVEHTQLISDSVIRKRALHVISEQIRVNESVKMLERGDFFTLGKLFDASHKSLKNLYEVSGYELDTICEAAVEQTSCYGARMTGAGFGGCAIALIDRSHFQEFAEAVGRIYTEKTALQAEFFIADSSEGVQLINSHSTDLPV